MKTMYKSYLACNNTLIKVLKRQFDDIVIILKGCYPNQNPFGVLTDLLVDSCDFEMTANLALNTMQSFYI